MNHKDDLKYKINNMLDIFQETIDNLIYYYNDYNDNDILDECKYIIAEIKNFEKLVDDFAKECERNY